MNNILITTECVADLPSNSEKFMKDYGIIYYDIKTEGGLFRDTKEIMSLNVLEYMMGGHKVAISVVPSANDYKNFFTDKLREYDEIIHISISSGISEAHENANLAKAKMGREGHKINIVDSRHLSSGQGLITMKAINCRDQGMTSKEILACLKEYIPNVSTSFLAENADYLYYNGKVEKIVMQICNAFKLHPVLEIVNGKLTVKRVYIGKYKRCAINYIKDTLGNVNKIDTKRGFITYAGCGEELLNFVNEEIDKRISFDELYEEQASATVSCNCGPNTFGILFARNS